MHKLILTILSTFFISSCIYFINDSYYFPSGIDGRIHGDSDGVPRVIWFDLEEYLTVNVSAGHLYPSQTSGAGGVRIVINLIIPNGVWVTFLENSITIEDLISGKRVEQQEAILSYYDPAYAGIEKPFPIAGYSLIGYTRVGKVPSMFLIATEFKGFNPKSFKLILPKFLVKSYLSSNGDRINENEHKLEIKFTEEKYNLKTAFERGF